jgi:hypothetical protein
MPIKQVAVSSSFQLTSRFIIGATDSVTTLISGQQAVQYSDQKLCRIDEKHVLDAARPQKMIYIFVF